MSDLVVNPEDRFYHDAAQVASDQSLYCLSVVFSIIHCKTMKATTQQSYILNGLIQLIMMGRSNWLIWVNVTYSLYYKVMLETIYSYTFRAFVYYKKYKEKKKIVHDMILTNSSINSHLKGEAKRWWG